MSQMEETNLRRSERIKKKTKPIPDEPTVAIEPYEYHTASGTPHTVTKVTLSRWQNAILEYVQHRETLSVRYDQIEDMFNKLTGKRGALKRDKDFKMSILKRLLEKMSQIEPPIAPLLERFGEIGDPEDNPTKVSYGVPLAAMTFSQVKSLIRVLQATSDDRRRLKLRQSVARTPLEPLEQPPMDRRFSEWAASPERIATAFKKLVEDTFLSPQGRLLCTQKVQKERHLSEFIGPVLKAAASLLPEDQKYLPIPTEVTKTADNTTSRLLLHGDLDYALVESSTLAEAVEPVDTIAFVVEMKRDFTDRQVKQYHHLRLDNSGNYTVNAQMSQLLGELTAPAEARAKRRQSGNGRGSLSMRGLLSNFNCWSFVQVDADGKLRAAKTLQLFPPNADSTPSESDATKKGSAAGPSDGTASSGDGASSNQPSNKRKNKTEASGSAKPGMKQTPTVSDVNLAALKETNKRLSELPDKLKDPDSPVLNNFFEIFKMLYEQLCVAVWEHQNPTAPTATPRDTSDHPTGYDSDGDSDDDSDSEESSHSAYMPLDESGDDSDDDDEEPADEPDGRGGGASSAGNPPSPSNESNKPGASGSSTNRTRKDGGTRPMQHREWDCDEQPLSRKQYGDATLIARGTFGSLYRFTKVKRNGEICNCAVKMLSTEEEANNEAFFMNKIDKYGSDNERVVHLLRRHPVVCRNGKPAIVMEWCPGQNLEEYVRSRESKRLRLPTVQIICAQVLEGLSFLHEKVHIIHADLKPDNIMVEQVGTNGVMCRITDFGNAFQTQRRRIYLDIQSLRYQAIEVVIDAGFGRPADIWSLGCVIFFAATGCQLFRGAENPRELLRLMIDTLGEIPTKVVWEGRKASEYFEKYSNHLLTGTPTMWPLSLLQQLHYVHLLPTSEAVQLDAFLAGCFTYDQTRRPTAREMLASINCWQGGVPSVTDVSNSEEMMTTAAATATNETIKEELKDGANDATATYRNAHDNCSTTTATPVGSTDLHLFYRITRAATGQKLKRKSIKISGHGCIDTGVLHNVTTTDTQPTGELTTAVMKRRR